MTNRRGQTVSFGYDAGLGYLNSRTTPEGTTTYGARADGGMRATQKYEAADTVYTDHLGRDTVALVMRPTTAYRLTYTYDALGRRSSVGLAQIAGPPGAMDLGTVRYHYTTAGQLDSLYDASGAVTTFGYDLDGARVSTTLPGAGATNTAATAVDRAGGVRFPNAPALDQAFGFQVTQFGSLGRVREQLTAGSNLFERPGVPLRAAGQLDSSYTVTYGAPAGTSCTPLYGTAFSPTDPSQQPTGYSARLTRSARSRT